MNFPLIILRCTLLIIFLVQTWLIHPLPSFALTVQQVSNPRQDYHGWVTDMAEILSPSTETQLNQMISDLEAKNGAEIAVVTVPETQPTPTPKELATKLFHYWGIGKKGQDNGVLFLVSIGDRRVEIETGKGIQETLPNATVSNIIDSKIIPEFKSGNFESGVVAGTKELVTSLKTEKYQLGKASTAGIVSCIFIVIGIFMGILVIWIFWRIFKILPKTQMSPKTTYISRSSNYRTTGNRSTNTSRSSYSGYNRSSSYSNSRNSSSSYGNYDYHSFGGGSSYGSYDSDSFGGGSSYGDGGGDSCGDGGGDGGGE
ncbi:TPM domain-containing protein [Dapis sp. BLCC M172]|uniref:TPM domain-containing protein n=1 Tax=Dapis sp. BLCC M172 TaxID=2975281 RepID=UPI003CE70123